MRVLLPPFALLDVREEAHPTPMHCCIFRKLKSKEQSWSDWCNAAFANNMAANGDANFSSSPSGKTIPGGGGGCRETNSAKERRSYVTIPSVRNWDAPGVAANADIAVDPPPATAKQARNVLQDLSSWLFRMTLLANSCSVAALVPVVLIVSTPVVAVVPMEEDRGFVAVRLTVAPPRRANRNMKLSGAVLIVELVCMLALGERRFVTNPKVVVPDKSAIWLTSENTTIAPRVARTRTRTRRLDRDEKVRGVLEYCFVSTARFGNAIAQKAGSQNSISVSLCLKDSFNLGGPDYCDGH